MPYNPLIANAFFRAGLIEAWGRGIYKIISECETFGAAPPKFNCDFSGLMVEFGAKSEEVSGKTSRKTREKTREKILKLILVDASISIEEMSNKIGITQKGIEWQIMRLKKEKMLERIGPAKGGYWKIIKE